MSTLKVNTVQHNTSGFGNVVQFTDGAGTENGTLCRAWVNFNAQGTIAIRDDFNVSTITDNGVGNFQINFSNAMDNTNYCALMSFSAQNGTYNEYNHVFTTTNSTTAPSTDHYDILSYGQGSLRDPNYCCSAVFST